MAGLTYSQFAEKIIAAGYTPRDCQMLHWQIIGGPRLVNVWPHTQNGFCFQVEGMSVTRNSSIDRAIEAADGIYQLGTPNGRPTERYRKRIKKRLFGAKPQCHYCGKQLADLSVSVLEHNIPLCKGGTSERSNLVLACIPCDRAKGDKMPNDFNPERAVEQPVVTPPVVAAEPPAKLPVDRPLAKFHHHQFVMMKGHGLVAIDDSVWVENMNCWRYSIRFVTFANDTKEELGTIPFGGGVSWINEQELEPISNPMFVLRAARWTRELAVRERENRNATDAKAIESLRYAESVLLEGMPY